MQFVDFFSGIGGIRLGLEWAGHECVGFCEWDKFARQSYKAMHYTEGEWESHDIRATKPYDVPDADLWCFGFPCQDISVAGKQKGLQEGERSGLFYEIMRLLAGRRQEDRPRWLLVENVKNLLSIGNGFDFARLLLEVGGYGYSLQWQVLNSKDFGVPQNRERVFIVGYLGDIRGREVFPLRPTDGENPCELKEITGRLSMADRIYDTDGISRTFAAVGGGGEAKTGLYAVKVVKPFGTSCVDIKIKSNDNDLASTICARDYKGICRDKGDAVLVRFRYPERGEGSREKGYMEQVDCASALTSKHCGDQTADCSNGVLVAPVLTPDREQKRQNGRRIKEPGEPSFTLTAQDRHGVAIYQRPRGYNKGGFHDVAPALSISAWQENNLLADSIRIRRLTPRECWRLQGFPDEYFDKAKAAGISDTQLYKQAGNSVTVNVARAIGERLKEIENEGI
jgi:DNA (cytosine-5)-methyltransferase 1